jgi:hypothetical protein
MILLSRRMSGSTGRTAASNFHSQWPVWAVIRLSSSSIAMDGTAPEPLRIKYTKARECRPDLLGRLRSA